MNPMSGWQGMMSQQGVQSPGIQAPPLANTDPTQAILSGIDPYSLQQFSGDAGASPHGGGGLGIGGLAGLLSMFGKFGGAGGAATGGGLAGGLSSALPAGATDLAPAAALA